MLRYIRQILTYLTSHIRFKIILPYAVLTLMVAITGVYLSVRLVAEPLEERFKGELIESGRVVANGMAQREQLHLTTFRTIAFTEGLDEAIVNNDRGKLSALVFGVVANAGIDRVDIIGLDGRQLLEIHRPPGASSVDTYITSNVVENTTDWPIRIILQKVLEGVVEQGRDKFVALTTLDNEQLFLTVGPVKQGNRVVGAVIISSYTEDLVRSLRQLTSAEISVYDIEGKLVNTTFSSVEEATAALALDATQARLLLSVEGDASPQRSATIRGSDYDLLFGVFWARGEPLGFYSVIKETTFTDSISAVRNLMALIFAVALALVFGIGYLTSNAITGQLQHLMEIAVAVAKGDFTKRTEISSADEIGKLGHSLDEMTESLDHMTRSLARKITELTILHKNSTDMVGKSGPNLDHSLQALTTDVKNIMTQANQVLVHLLDEEGLTLIPKTFTPNGINTLPAFNFAQDSGLRNLLAGAEPQIVSQTQLEPYVLNGSFPKNGASELLITPLVAGQDLIGMLTLTPRPGQTPTSLMNDDTGRLLGTMVNQAAMSIKNARLFEELQDAYRDLQQLDKLKTEFINIAAHELRTPLGGIILAANFIEKRGDQKLQKKAHAIVVSTLRMRTMVDAMLTIQRLDAGTAFLQPTLIDVRDILRKVVHDFQPMAELEGHVINLNLPDDLPMIQADGEKVGLIVSNLLSNAIKFTPIDGQIEVTAQDYVKGIVIRVRDNGVGIAMEHQREIFERFHQVRPEHLAGHGGLGLGLYIVKHLVELHNGQVWVESQPGQGSTFSFTLPQEEAVDNQTGVTTSPGDARLNPRQEKLLEYT
ncbi:MAG TPA: ATP-binding protein [Anaerolineae bacterium]|jgi:signal transduction histidine kinase/HAMP domain-containing protein